MPLRDHFHSPFVDRYRWDMVHGMLPAVIAAYLNTVLPEQYQAGPTTHIGSLAEVDIGAVLGPGPEWDADSPPDHSGGVAVAPKVWSPPKATLDEVADWAAVDDYEVKVYDTSKALELVAAVEIVSPSNKDRQDHRRVFASKCAALLANDVSVIVVDLVTERTANLYAEMLGLIEVRDPNVGQPPDTISAVACKTRRVRNKRRLQTWYHPLVIGAVLPTLPVWLNDQHAVPLDLEPLYEQTLKSLRIR